MRPLRAFQQQRASAKYRGIDFRLSFEQWLDIWIRSGRLKQRGRYGKKYVMARPDDRGAYEVGNVEIVSFTRNNRSKRMSTAGRRRLRELNLGKRHTLEARRKMIGRPGRLGQPHTEATKRKISRSQRRRFGLIA